MSYLFRSVIPSSIAQERPMSGTVDPNGVRFGNPGQIYTQRIEGDDDVIWCKGGRAAKTGWFQLGTERGHPQVLVGNYFETDPNDLIVAAGPAVWYGYDKSVWVKTDGTIDSQNWNLLTYDPSIGLPDFFVVGGGNVSA